MKLAFKLVGVSALVLFGSTAFAEDLDILYSTDFTHEVFANLAYSKATETYESDYNLKFVNSNIWQKTLMKDEYDSDYLSGSAGYNLYFDDLLYGRTEPHYIAFLKRASFVGFGFQGAMQSASDEFTYSADDGYVFEVDDTDTQGSSAYGELRGMYYTGWGLGMGGWLYARSSGYDDEVSVNSKRTPDYDYASSQTLVGVSPLFHYYLTDDSRLGLNITYDKSHSEGETKFDEDESDSTNIAVALDYSAIYDNVYWFSPSVAFSKFSTKNKYRVTTTSAPDQNTDVDGASYTLAVDAGAAKRGVGFFYGGAFTYTAIDIERPEPKYQSQRTAYAINAYVKPSIWFNRNISMDFRLDYDYSKLSGDFTGFDSVPSGYYDYKGDLDVKTSTVTASVGMAARF